MGMMEVEAWNGGKIGDLVISLHTIQSFGTGKAVYVRFYTLHENSNELTKVFDLIDIGECFEGRNAEKSFQDLRVFFFAALTADLLKSLGKIVVVNN